MTSEEIFKAKKEAEVFYAIDPDSDKSGWAAVVVIDREMRSASFSFSDVVVFLLSIARKEVLAKKAEKVKSPLGKLIPKPFIIIEGGWLNESNWHVRGKSMTPARAAAIGRSVGMNHQTGILIAQMCESLNLPYEVVKPLPKHWKGKDGKITAEELAYFTGYTKRTNQDERDAILLAWTYAGLPVRVKPIGKDGGK